MQKLKHYPFSIYLLLLVNLYMFYLNFKENGTSILSGITPDQAVRVGAMDISHTHELTNPESIITSMFAHASVMHIFGNMFALLFFGTIVCRMWGNLSVFILYFVTGIAGNILTIMTSENMVSLGASGATFGLSGAALVGILFNDHARINSRNIIMLITGNIIYTFLMPGINIAAHVGGFIVGMALGIIFGISAFLITKWKQRMPKI